MARKSKKRVISTDAFCDFLAKRSELLDDEIIRSLHPTDTWIGTVSCGSWIPDWFTSLETVRQLSEGMAYQPSVAPNSIEETFDRFEKVFPDLNGCWTKSGIESVIGEPCDIR